MRVATTLLFVLSATHLACSSGSEGPPPGPTPVPPKVVLRNPASNTTDVPINAQVSVTFDQDMDSATLDSPATGFTLSTTGGDVAGAVTYASVEKTATFVPTSNFAASTLVTAHLDTTVTNSKGVAIAKENSWSFTTGTTADVTPPTFGGGGGIISATNNGNGTATLVWDAATDDTTPSSSIVYKIYRDSAPTTVIKSLTGATTTKTPQVTAGSYTYFVQARDSSGNQTTATTPQQTVAINYASVSFTDDVYPLLSGTCTSSSCHDAIAPQPQDTGGMDLSTRALAFSNTVNVASTEQPSFKRIKPTDHANSYLYMKLTNDPSITGVQMPKNKTPFNSLKLEMIRNWIDNGAPNN